LENLAGSAFSEPREFPYASLIPGTPIKLAIPIWLTGANGKSFPFFALPDSGADASCFPEEWAPKLGVDLSACEKHPVNTGAGKTHHHVWDAGLMAKINGLDIELEAVFGPINVPVLGRRDFFAHFHVEFNERAKLTYLTPF
jgi:hypothetical protein